MVELDIEDAWDHASPSDKDEQFRDCPTIQFIEEVQNDHDINLTDRQAVEYFEVAFDSGLLKTRMMPNMRTLPKTQKLVKELAAVGRNRENFNAS